MSKEKRITRQKSRIAMLPLSPMDVTDLVKRIVIHGVRVREVARLSQLVCKGGWSEAWRSLFNDVTECAKNGPAQAGEPQLESMALEYAFWRVTHLNNSRAARGTGSSVCLKLVSEQIPFAARKILENPRALLNEVRPLLGRVPAVKTIQRCATTLFCATAALTKMLPETTALEPEYRFYSLAKLLGRTGWTSRTQALLNACFAELEKLAAKRSCVSWSFLSRALSQLADFLDRRQDGLSVAARCRYALRIVSSIAFVVESIPSDRPKERRALLVSVAMSLQRSCRGGDLDPATIRAMQQAWTRLKRGVREEGWLPERFRKGFDGQIVRQLF